MKFAAFLLAVLLVFAGGAFAGEAFWAKGNIHTHTTNSDGDSAPQVVADWYKDHGYQWLAITDHGVVTDPSTVKTGEGFVLITGEELGVRGAERPIHANGLGLAATLVTPTALATPAHSLHDIVQLIRDAGGIPQVNHPNFKWSFGHRELLQVKSPYLLEIANGHPTVHNCGDVTHLPVEQTWDILLSNGETVYATATDDAHHFKVFDAKRANPGRGWVVVRVSALDPKEILSALRSGRFYASTGVELKDCCFDGKTFGVRVVPKKDVTYLIRFVGKWGAVLQESPGVSATYRLQGQLARNAYVRCKVIGSDGSVAWTQAFRIGGRQ